MTPIDYTGYEFFIFEGKLMYKTPEAHTQELEETDRQLIGFLVTYIKEFYPEAMEALKKVFQKSIVNIPYFEYRVVKRFASCNLGNIDHIPDINTQGKLILEHVPCPLRGECIHENIVCHPKFNVKISEAEMRVLEPLYRGQSREEIAEELYLSVHTVKNHIRNAFTRIGVKNTAEFIAYAYRHKLFKEE